MKRHYQALGRKKAGTMNKTEQAYANRLELLKQSGEILDFWYEAINLRLADKCFLKMDFLVMTKDRELELHETKGGFVTDDSLVKLKVIAEKYPFQVRMMQLKKGQWSERTF